MILLFVCTLFLSSTLLFLVQPMIAKMVLPLLGGTPAVWNTCMVFFQATLLLGYLYVHAVTRWLRLGRQALLHVALLVVSLLALPVAVSARDNPPADGMPILWLARVLLFAVGVPFFVVSTSGPLLQRWFARTDHPSASDPYFLSVAGNLGSIVALLAYPAGLEPTLRLAEQSGLWASGYAVFVALTIVSVCAAYRRVAQDAGRTLSGPPEAGPDKARPTDPRAPIMWAQRARWIALAFVPSSLMLGLTTFLTTDVAAVPLFWVVPLTIYLLSFALVFAKRPVLSHALMARLLPMFALVLVTVIVFASQLPPLIQAPLHLLTFFAAAMVCHGELARSRPGSEGLTQFYLMMSIGGVLGGLFNALIAPIAFRTVVEYPLAIVLACAARPAPKRNVPMPETASSRANLFDIVVPAAFGVLALVLMTTFGNRDPRDPVAIVLLYVLPSLLCFSFKRRPMRFALSLGALMIASGIYVSAHERVPYRGRSFFSVYRLVDNPQQRLRLLIHGRTIHGAQSLDPARRSEPLTYFHRTGPIGQAFGTFHEGFAKPRVAIIGLGVGSLAAYAQPGETWTFYEIDPTIADMARDRRYFTFLADAKTDVRVTLGDARISLEKEPDSAFDLLVVDAFGSDAIPVHLLTKEALRLYWRRLGDHAVLAFHISNRYMDLQPVLGDLASDAGLAALSQDDSNLTDADVAAGKQSSRWVLMARSAADFGPLATDHRWHRLDPRPKPIVWTDDFSNPLALMRWF